MTRDEIVTALRCCEQHKRCEGACPLIAEFGCIEKAMSYAADLIENQQRHIEALMKANDSLKDAIARRDRQIEDMKQGVAQMTKAVAVKEEQYGTTYSETGGEEAQPYLRLGFSIYCAICMGCTIYLVVKNLRKVKMCMIFLIFVVAFSRKHSIIPT